MSSTTHGSYTPVTTISDPVFLSGLSAILAPYYARQASSEEIQQVTDRAHEFYLSSTQAADQPSSPLAPPSVTTTTTTTTAAAAAASGDEPPYPLSFSHLAHLIQTGAPIPGIKDVPDKLADEAPTESTHEIQRKPWELATAVEAQDERGAGEHETRHDGVDATI